jgi:hypothetical protein
MREHKCLMQDLLEEIDADYYRAARLLIVRAELKQLRDETSAADAGRRSRGSQGGSSPTDRAGRSWCEPQSLRPFRRGSAPAEDSQPSDLLSPPEAAPGILYFPHEARLVYPIFLR